MPYELLISDVCEESIYKLCRKNSTLNDALSKKIKQILEDPYRFKPLKKPLNNRRRVHIMKSFVLSYDIIEETKMVRLLKFSHHDDAY